MTRRTFLPQAHPTMLLVFLAVAAAVTVAAPAVRAQDVSTQERLDRLERDMTMLQRQVYRGTGGEAPPGAESGGGTAVDVQVRMDRLEQQMRDLTGRVEDRSNQVQQLRQRVEQINSDIDVRLNQGKARARARRRARGKGRARARTPRQRRRRAGARARWRPPSRRRSRPSRRR